MALAWAGQGVIVPEVFHGAGRHISDVDPAIYQTGVKLNFTSQPFFLVAICMVKLCRIVAITYRIDKVLQIPDSLYYGLHSSLHGCMRLRMLMMLCS